MTNKTRPTATSNGERMRLHIVVIAQTCNVAIVAEASNDWKFLVDLILASHFPWEGQ